jgi:hypothetical protein
MMRRAAFLVFVVAFCATGCVSVDTPDTNVKVGITSLNLPGSEKDPNTAAYAKPMKKVTAQQAEVSEQFAKRDWEELAKESSDWVAYTRDLAGYANSSHNPPLFRSCCDQLAVHAQGIRDAAMRHDEAGVQRALAACDQPLDQLVQHFPLTRGPGQAAVASPPPTPAPAAQRSAEPARRSMVP